MRIVVVDDHVPTIELMHLTLISFGHSVRSAANVTDALELVATECPDVICSDLTLSSVGQDRDGHALASAVRSLPACTGVGMLAITGVVTPSTLQAALDSGFDDVMVKPFDVESLIERIETLGQSTGRR